MDFYTAFVPISDKEMLNTVAKGNFSSTSVVAQKNVTAEQVAVLVL